MKKLLLFAVAAFFLGTSGVSAMATHAPLDDEQEESFKKERRIFLWDVTISMVGATRDANCPKGAKRSAPDFDYASSGFPNYNAKKDIFDNTREKLIKMIYETPVESTEIIVLPFRNGIVGEFKASATAAGKEQLRNDIMNWNDLQAGGTFTATCLKDAVNKYFTKDRINRIFLLTDGEPSNDESDKLFAYLKNWKGIKETKGSSSYLVYVMLTDEAYNDELVNIGKNSDGDIIVTEEFENPVWITINKSASLHVREYFDGKIAADGRGSIEIPYSFVAGKDIPEKSVFHCIVDDNEFIKVDPSTPVRPVDGKFSIPFQFTLPFESYLTELPQDYNFTVTAKIVKDNDANKIIDITGSNVFEVGLVVKPEPRVKISWSTE